MERTTAAEPLIACTLEPDAVQARLAHWRALLDQARGRSRTDEGSLRVDFDGGVDLVELARLVEAEQRCCAFFAFAITVDQRGVGLEVRTPEGADDLARALFG